MKILRLCILALAAPCAFADALDHLESFLQTTTLKADFVQKVYDNENKLLETSAGSTWVHRPGKFRWEYHSPQRYIIVTDGLNLLAYDPDLAQAYVRPTMEALGTAPLVVLLNRHGVFEDFRVDLRPDHDGLEWADLTPRVDDSEFIRFTVGFSKDGVLRRMMLFDRFEQRIEISFSNLQADVALSTTQFNVKLPEGTDVIGDYLQ